MRAGPVACFSLGQKKCPVAWGKPAACCTMEPRTQIQKGLKRHRTAREYYYASLLPAAGKNAAAALGHHCSANSEGPRPRQERRGHVLISSSPHVLLCKENEKLQRKGASSSWTQAGVCPVQSGLPLRIRRLRASVSSRPFSSYRVRPGPPRGPAPSRGAGRAARCSRSSW